MVPFGYSPPGMPKIDNGMPTATSTYSKNDMLQQYQPVYGNRYLFPPAWGTGRVKYFSDGRFIRRYYSNRQQASPVWTSSSVAYENSDGYVHHSSNGDSEVEAEHNAELRSTSNARPWRFTYAYKAPKMNNVQPNLIPDGSTWYVNPNRRNTRPKFAIVNRVLRPNQINYAPHSPQSLHARRRHVERSASRRSYNTPTISFSVFPTDIRPPRWKPSGHQRKVPSTPNVRPIYRHDGPTTYQRVQY
ncbi:unnamed protein product [Dicrocoelium dendriticum]|nr:unnamed protein product [Dicrocoelium dendriticum]